jgi:hypothetical protein
MPKKEIITLISILILGIIFYLFSLQLIQFKTINRVEEKLIDKQFSEKASKFSVTGGKLPGPIFEKELIIDPLEPRLGEIQTFSIWVKDSKGIEKVIGEIETDKGKKILEFKLVDGDSKEGRWIAKWQVKDISQGKYYFISIVAVSESTQETRLNFPLWIAQKGNKL